MAVVSFDVKELEDLTGKKLSSDLLENKIPMMGCEFEGLENGNVDYEIFPNRPDLLSVEGFARALRYFLGLDEGVETYKTTKSGQSLEIDKTVDPVRPCISAAIVKNMSMDDSVLKSLMQVQEKIHKTFGRERRKIAIGIHDFDCIEGPFTYKAVDPKKVEFIPLQSTERMDLREIGRKHPKGKYTEILKNHDKWPVIVDKNDEVLSFPPVINGKLTEVTEDTENIFIDVTGTDQRSVDHALSIISTLFWERNGSIETVTVNGKEKPDLDPEEMAVDINYVNKLLDLELSEKEFAELIRGMGFGYSDGKVRIPPYRTDIMHPMDIVEDVGISYGYSNFEVRIPDVPGVGKQQKVEEFSEKVKELIIGFGFQEVKTTVLTNYEKQFLKMEREREEVTEMENPLSGDYKICRKYLLPGLMEVIRQNQHRSYPQKVFEMGDIVKIDKDKDVGTENRRKLGALISNDNVNYSNLASVVSSLMDILGKKPKIKRHKSGTYLENRAGKFVLGDKEIGTVGEIHPKVLENWGIEKPVVAFELDLDLIRKNKS